MSYHYAVMGNPIAHSLSPLIHQLFAQQTGRLLTYEKILIDVTQFEQQVTDFFKQGGKGLNITLPFKQRAFAMSNQATARCLQAQAANTLWMHGEILHADNTDGVGLLRDLQHHIDVTGKTILVLGAGGAARGIIAPLLAALPAKLTIANRSIEKAQALQQTFPGLQRCGYSELIEPYDVIINATSLSNTHFPHALMSYNSFGYDLSYDANGLTPFVTWVRAQGGTAVDGLGMLVEQAAESFAIWHGIRPDPKPVLAYLGRKP